MGVSSSGNGETLPDKSGRPRLSTSGRRKPPAIRFSRTIPSNHSLSATLQDELMELVVKVGFRGSEFFAIKLSLEEAMVNAIKHGNRNDPKKQVRVEARLSEEKVEFTIEDEGPGFDRRSVPDPCLDENLEKCSGRGILLIEAYMSRVSWDHGGRRLRMIKVRQEAEKLTAQ